MALTNANVTMTFTRYEVEDGGVRLYFVAINPGAGQESEYNIVFTDAEATAISTIPQFNTAVISKLQRKLRAAAVASQLNALIGRTVTI